MIQTASDIFIIVLAFIFLGFFALVAWKIIDDTIKLDYLVSEPDGKASLSRFQLLLFTFVIGGILLVLSIEAGQFIEVPDGVQVLLGISGGGFVASKAVGAAKKQPAAPGASLKTPPNDGKQPE